MERSTLPHWLAWRKAQQQSIVCWDENDLNLSSNEVGLYASPTKVVSTQVPQSNKSIEWLTDATNIMQIIQESIHPQK